MNNDETVPSARSGKKRLKNTSLRRQVALMQEPGDAHKEIVTTVPASGRNGELTKLLSRAQAYKTQTISDRTIETNKQIQAAKEQKALKLKQAHIEATKKINSARFSAFWFVSHGRIQKVDAEGNLSNFVCIDIDGKAPLTLQTIEVQANAAWMSTGIHINVGETVCIEYIKGAWTISETDGDKNLDANGTTREFPQAAKDTLTLPTSPAGALIGKVANGAPFFVGNKLHLKPSQYGELFLGINEDASGLAGQGFKDNSGSLQIKVTLIKGLDNVEACDLALDQSEQFIFWAEPRPPFYLHKAKLNGSTHEIINSPAHYSLPNVKTNAIQNNTFLNNPIVSVALDDVEKQVYYILGCQHIVRSNYDGGDCSTILDIRGPTKDGCWQLEVDSKGKKLFWTNDYSVWRANLDGTEPKLIISNHEAPFPIDIAVDSESKKLYWVDKELKAVRRANLDGSQIEDLYSVEHPVRGLMLDYIPLGLSPSTHSKCDKTTKNDTTDVLKQEIYWAAREESIHSQTPNIVEHWTLEKGRDDSVTNSINAFDNPPLGVAKTTLDLPPNLSPPCFAISFSKFDYVKVPNRFIDCLTNSSFTIEMWVKPNSVTDFNEMSLLSQDVDTGTKTLAISVVNGHPVIDYGNNTLTSESKISPNKWTHLAFRFDLVNQKLSIIINGLIDATTKATVVKGMERQKLVLLGYCQQHPYVGLIADLRINPQALSEQSITNTMLANAGSNLINEVIMGPQWDYNSVPPTLRRYTSSLVFNGDSNYVNLGKANSLFLSQHSFTIECWFKLSEQTSNKLTIVGSVKSEEDDQFGLEFYVQDGLLHVANIVDICSGTTKLLAGNWYHGACSFNAASMQYRVYINGKKESQVKAQNIFAGQYDVFLGRMGKTRNLFLGNLSDVRIWNVARDDHQITSNYRQFREAYALRGPVDGSSEPEHLFDIPAEGALNLVSHGKQQFEDRLIAYRKQKNSQEKVAAKIQEAHDEKTLSIDAKNQELQRTQQETSAQIDQKKAEHAKEREINRTKYIKANNAKTQAIIDAKALAIAKRESANNQANEIKSNAYNKTNNMKNKARKDRQRAKEEVNKHKR